MIKDTPIAVTGIECFSLDATMIMSLIVHSHGVSDVPIALAKNSIEALRCRTTPKAGDLQSSL